MAYDNLPGVYTQKVDGNLIFSATSGAPNIAILGTAEGGPSNSLRIIQRSSDLISQFGKNGTLPKGILETLLGGGTNVFAYRIGSTPAIVEDIGGVSGLRLETIAQDGSAGTDYALTWDDTNKVLRTWRVSDELLVYQKDFFDNSESIEDLLEVDVSGMYATGGADITTTSGVFSNYSDAVPLASISSPATYIAGDDGVTLSRMELYEELYSAYQLLEESPLDFVVPVGAFLDDKNIADLSDATITTLNTSPPWATTPTYPTPSTSHDFLGKVYVQEYQGKNYFWWDMDNDNIAEIYPSMGSASSSANIDGDPISTYHEVNFAYQLANFCFNKSQNNRECLGFISPRGLESPVSASNIATWIGRSPNYSRSGDNLVIANSSDNGSGLLGNKFVAGRKGAPSGPAGLMINGIEGLAYGGFIGTDTGFLGGTELKDINDHLVDIGKYISLVAASPFLTNEASNGITYISEAAPYYAGFVSALSSNSSPTNKVARLVLPYTAYMSASRANALTGKRYVTLWEKAKGVVWADAPVATRPNSDYSRLTTMRIVKTVLDGLREVSDPFIGEPNSPLQRDALSKRLDRKLAEFVSANYLTSGTAQTFSSAQQTVLGQITVELTLVPVFEVREITIVTSLSAI